MVSSLQAPGTTSAPMSERGQRATRLLYSQAAMRARAWVRGRPLNQVVAGAAVMAVLGAALAYVGTAHRITLVDDGAERTIFTHAGTVGGAVRSAGERIAPQDFLQPAEDTSLQGVDRIEYRSAQMVLVQTPEASQWVTTAAVLPSDILAAAGLRLFPADRLWADGMPVSTPLSRLEHVPHRLRLERGQTLTISQPAAGTMVIHSSASTLGEALIDAGCSLREGDSVVPQAQTPLAGLASADYLAARPIHITVDGLKLEAMASGPTVGQALEQAGIPLAGLDRSEPAASEILPSGGEVTVTRVREDVLVEQVPVPPTTKPEYSAELELDTRKVLDPGAYGMQAKRVRVRYEDGVEVSRVAEGEWRAIEPKERVVAYGTKIVLRTLSTEYGPIQYYRTVTVYATSYSPCRSGASRCLYYTSSRMPVQRGVIAVRYAWYLALGFGIPVYIPGYGTATIEDIGGGFPDRYWIDLGYSDEDWVEWGEYTTLYFIAPVPPDVPVIFP
jgi:resuscitation-promoting factor RpfB